MIATTEKKTKKTELRSENPDPVDIHVGARLRMRRNLIGLSQEQLGKSLGLTFQQIQKYERGINRMGSSRLFQIAKTLSVPVAYFFDDMPTLLDMKKPPRWNGKTIKISCAAARLWNSFAPTIVFKTASNAARFTN